MQSFDQEKCLRAVDKSRNGGRQTIQDDGGRKRPAKNTMNPLQAAIQSFITSVLPPNILQNHGLALETLVPSLPKRYTIYKPLLLLPANAFITPPTWHTLYAGLDNKERHDLYEFIVKTFARRGVTHLAINAPISQTDTHGNENRMRSPVGLVPLYGDFGPLPLGDAEYAKPTELDLQMAFWVRTVQNHGIAQVWSPLYTMFSRGNITEKARILGDGTSFEGLDSDSLGDEQVGDISAVDMYAGIGYFVFSYLKRGVRRVWGWELNGWSVEGLRRGCIENGWGCRVFKIQDHGGLDVSIPNLVESLRDTDRVVIFHGDNQFAADILHQIKSVMDCKSTWKSVRHANLGLLPSSRPAWRSACKMIDLQRGGWVHIHENVDIQRIDQRKEDVIAELKKLRTEVYHDERLASVEVVAECRHVEQVKTYAPGVMHCVFDIKLSSSYSNI